MVEKQQSRNEVGALHSDDSEQFGAIAHSRHEAIAVMHNHDTHQTEREMLTKAKELATNAEKNLLPKDSRHPSGRRTSPLNKQQLENSFNTQMQYASTEMTGNERFISRFIHIKPIEKTSDFLSSTFARPNAMLAGSITAFITVTVMYFTSKYFGYELSGFETIAGFAFGWVLGLIYDYVLALLRGHR